MLTESYIAMTRNAAERVFIQKRRDELLENHENMSRLMERAIRLNKDRCNAIIHGCRSGLVSAFLDLDDMLYMAAEDCACDDYQVIREAA